MSINTQELDELVELYTIDAAYAARARKVGALSVEQSKFKKKLKALIESAIQEARDEYPWQKIAGHGTYEVPIVNLDKGGVTEYQECYLLPKKWVDSKLASLTNSDTKEKPPVRANGYWWPEDDGTLPKNHKDCNDRCRQQDLVHYVLRTELSPYLDQPSPDTFEAKK